MPERRLRILHVMRAPVGGLFRHVVDLAREQAARGHEVGIVTDALTGGPVAAERLAVVEPKLALGLSRIGMSRDVGIRDGFALRHVRQRAQAGDVDVLHGHGAKGGAYARFANGPWLKVYTPHGGSLHYPRYSPRGIAYLTAERVMCPRTNLLLFESEFGRRAFHEKVGEPALERVVHNGITQEELSPVEPESDAADFFFVGELRKLKGPDVLLEALAILAREGWNGHALFYGEGGDRPALEAQAGTLGILHQVHFAGIAPARTAFASGRVLVVPSRAESLPYIVLEAAGAGVPMVATRVGGIPEIFGPDAEALLPPADAEALAVAMHRVLREGAGGQTERLRDRVGREFSVEAMTNGVLAAYAAAFTFRASQD